MPISRRNFTRLSALGLAANTVHPAFASLAPQTADPNRKIGFCIIGLGGIANHFMRALQDSTQCRITGLVSGHRDKAERIAAQYGVPTSSIYDYTNMDAIAKNKEIDAVYVALPNGMHAEYTIRSAKADKHVLC